MNAIDPTPDSSADPNWEFIGWIPCLAGELLFKHTLPALAEYDIAVVNFLGRPDECREQTVRYVAATSVYDWKDSGDPSETGVFRVVVIAQTDRNSMKSLNGDLFFISETPMRNMAGANALRSEHDYEKDLFCLVKDLEARVIAIQRKILVGGPARYLDELAKIQHILSLEEARSTIEESLFGVINKIDNKYVHRVKFSIDNAGFCLLDYIGLKDPLSGAYEPPTLPAGSAESSLRLREHRSTLCRQAFYYLKYLLHRHTHHDASNDSLCTTHRYSGKSIETARALLHDLKSGLVDIKRGFRREKADVAGVAAYGKSLVTSCFKSGFFGKNDCGMTEYKVQHDYFEHLSQSIQFLHARNQPNRDRLRQRLTAIQQISAICFLFITPLIFVGKSLPKTCIQPIAVNWPFMEGLTDLVARLGHGDVQLIVEVYVGILAVAGIFHLRFVDKRKFILASSRSVFNYMRPLAVSYAACQNGLLGKLSWRIHRSFVTVRRRIRGAAYRAWTPSGFLLFMGLLVVLLLVAVGLISVGLSTVFNLI